MPTVPTPRVARTPQLSDQTVFWLAARPHERRVVRSVWDTLTDLERTGHHAGALAALRAVLLDHQPRTRTGRCRTCRRLSWWHLWRRHPFPCAVWMTIRIELLELLSNTHSPGTTTPSSGCCAAPPTA